MITFSMFLTWRESYTGRRNHHSLNLILRKLLNSYLGNTLPWSGKGTIVRSIAPLTPSVHQTLRYLPYFGELEENLKRIFEDAPR
jgi:hypothetical protein